ncbi:MAG: tRNA (adenosine(37)-N6)-threonylcarbamoyltransferase complex dimerization subunit type 1 TsaB [Candidatus Omnitrophica bacterium]|nr:tRNA (adenosine(37)-N6)-threonylcarbamoyltransferase complex dimerization subunit type 1 TsaB [Candidatus Omnitrophota bacterium]MCM8802451.1 tRNA (adenosine(37)-N6)-threonylcarbamoyltransferase complex dimerization subunit type 1 TsaB [Candidatus Omnitrophota bacterium]
MKILSIETTTNFGSIALLQDDIIKKEIFFESSDLAGELIEKLNYVYEEFDYIVVCSGPGSWTGVRIGMSFAKGIVLGQINKIYAVSVFDSIFYSVKNIKAKFLGIVYCSRDIFYCSEFNGRFNYKKSFKIKKIILKDLLSIVKKNDYTLIGPGLMNLKEFTKLERIKTNYFLSYPRASLNGLVAYQKIKRKILSLPLEPIYGK